VLIGSLGQAVTLVTSDFPNGTSKTAILAGIAKGQMMILEALNIAMMIGGKR